MGIGDDIIATGLARGAQERGKRIAFGNGQQIIWGPYSKMIFKNNPNIAMPGTERGKDIEWMKYYKGNRIYNSQNGNKWRWNYDFKVQAGELFFDLDEERPKDSDLIIVEPNVPNKSVGINKQWPFDRFKAVVQELTRAGFKVRQFEYGRPLRVAEGICAGNFRLAAGYIKSARLAILPEGGLHHAAAALEVPAIVLFGGFAPPSVLGYNGHINLTGRSEIACGNFHKCDHCISTMNSITVDQVLEAAEKLLCP